MNTKNIKKINKLSNNFNISFEIELESNNIKSFDSDILTDLTNSNTPIELKNKIKYYYKTLKSKNIEKFQHFINYNVEYGNFLNVLFKIKDKKQFINYIYSFSPNTLEYKFCRYIKLLFTNNYFIKKDNTLIPSNLLIESLSKHLPNFYNKYKPDIKFVFEPTILFGFEIILNTYLTSLNDSIDYINEFFNDFNNQDNFIFSKNTSIHVNISMKDLNNYKMIKGLLFLNDYHLTKIPYIFKNNESRIGNKYCKSLRYEITKIINNNLNELKYKDLKNILNKLKLNSDLSSIETIFNDLFYKFIQLYGEKNIGFNINKIIEKNYIEYRYTGGLNINKDILINKLYYYCYITYLMLSDYKQKKYMNKLNNFNKNILYIQ
jgi:hypothetical protein